MAALFAASVASVAASTHSRARCRTWLLPHRPQDIRTIHMLILHRTPCIHLRIIHLLIIRRLTTRHRIMRHHIIIIITHIINRLIWLTYHRRSHRGHPQHLHRRQQLLRHLQFLHGFSDRIARAFVLSSVPRQPSADDRKMPPLFVGQRHRRPLTPSSCTVVPARLAHSTRTRTGTAGAGTEGKSKGAWRFAWAT